MFVAVQIRLCRLCATLFRAGDGVAGHEVVPVLYWKMVARCSNDILFGAAGIGDDGVGLQVRSDLCHDMGRLTNRHRQKHQISVVQSGGYVSGYFINDTTVYCALHILLAAANPNNMFEQASLT